MTLPPANSPTRGFTRRRFLGTAAAGFALWQCGPAARDLAASSPTAPELTAYDDLMESFVRNRRPPGTALAVTYRGRLVYARGFGWADRRAQEPVRADSLFRIASISKTFTSAAVMRLVEEGKLGLDDRVLPLLKLEPHLEPGAKMDPRWRDITVRHCLQHTGGWNRGLSFDPMAAVTSEEVAKALGVKLPVTAEQIIRYSMGKPLDSDPGTAYAYSNFGYCVLGRVIERVSGKPYDELVREKILTPLGIRRMRLGKNLLADRAPGEVRYYDSRRGTGRAISGPNIGEQVPLPYGVECLETMDANGGWIASAVDLVRFAAALDNPKRCPILSERSIRTMLAPPPGAVGHEADGRPKQSYYACGWFVQASKGRSDKLLKAHPGMLCGSSTYLVARPDGVDWAVLFNCNADRRGREFAGLIHPLLQKTADQIQNWPDVDLFPRETSEERG